MAAVAFSSKSEATEVTTTTISWTHTVASSLADSMMVIIILGRTDSATPTITATVGGNAATARVFQYQNNTFAAILTYANPSSGNVTVAGSSGGVAINTLYGASAVFYNVGGYDTGGNKGGNATSDSLSLTVASSDSMLIDALSYRTTGSPSFDAAQTVLYNANKSGDNNIHIGCSYKSASSGSQTMSFSGLGGDYYSYAAIALSPTADDGGQSILFI